MASTLSKDFSASDKIQQTYTIESWHVSQSVDALTGAAAYDITISGSLDITNSVNTGDLIGTASWATNSTNAVKLTALSNFTTNQAYNVPYATTSSATYEQFYKEDGTDMTYNPSTNTLTVANFEGTASWANNAITASIAESLTSTAFTGTFTRNSLTQYAVGTIYSKRADIEVDGAAALMGSDLLAAAGGTSVGNTTLPVIADPLKTLRMRIVGKLGAVNSSTWDFWASIGGQVLPATTGSAITFGPQNENKPFEIIYDFIWDSGNLYTCGSFRTCDQNNDYSAYAISDLYAPTSSAALTGQLEFFASASTQTGDLTGSVAYIEFLN